MRALKTCRLEDAAQPARIPARVSLLRHREPRQIWHDDGRADGEMLDEMMNQLRGLADAELMKHVADDDDRRFPRRQPRPFSIELRKWQYRDALVDTCAQPDADDVVMMPFVVDREVLDVRSLEALQVHQARQQGYKRQIG